MNWKISFSWSCRLFSKPHWCPSNRDHLKERWCGGTIINLLRNPIYTGAYYYNKRQHVPAKRRNMPGDAPPRKHNSSRVTRPREEWIAIEVPSIVDQETWELAREQLQRNKER